MYALYEQDKALAALRRFKERRGKEYAITDIGLFGSVVRDEAVEASDVDVVYKTDRPNLFQRLDNEATPHAALKKGRTAQDGPFSTSC